jgi:hypothetical protein
VKGAKPALEAFWLPRIGGGQVLTALLLRTLNTRGTLTCPYRADEKG